MDKEQMKDEIILMVKFEIGASSLGDYGVTLDDNDVDHVAESVAESLIEKGYRKTFTSDFASNTQKVSELEAENKYLLKLIESEHFSYQTTTCKKYSVFNTVRKQLAEELKKRSYCDNIFKDGKRHRYVFVEEIDELLKEYDK